MKSKPKPATIDENLASVPQQHRATLQQLRRTIRAVAPRAEECISYKIPAFRLDGKMLAWFAAARNHCSLFPGSTAVEQNAAELKKYDVSKGTVRFPADKPLPPTLVRKLIKTKIATMRGTGDKR